MVSEGVKWNTFTPALERITGNAVAEALAQKEVLLGSP